MTIITGGGTAICTANFLLQETPMFSQRKQGFLRVFYAYAVEEDEDVWKNWRRLQVISKYDHSPVSLLLNSLQGFANDVEIG